MSKINFTHDYNYIISLENLLGAWREFLRGKRSRKDVQSFSLRLIENIYDLHSDLLNNQYYHGRYEAFRINDPKPRNIHKSQVRDRLLHHAVYRQLYPFFDRIFITDSFSCRINKATYKAIKKFRKFYLKESLNDTRTCWVLKCDIRKFFENINHQVILDILGQYIFDQRVINLLKNIIYSFSSAPGRGLPLGNLTSQLLVNIYMNEFDQYVKHKLKAKYYIRYADDFVVLSHDKSLLEELLPKIGDYLKEELKLDLHPDKISIKTIFSGVDFLGWVHFPDHRILRSATKNRMIRNLEVNKSRETKASYLGLLKHGNTYNIKKKLSL